MAKNNVKKAKVKGRGWRIFGIVIACLLLIAVVWALVGCVGYGANAKLIKAMATVEVEDQLTPVIDEATGYYTFTTDRDFKVLQLTDVHVGGGALSIGKDNKAINAVYDLVNYTKPDLVIITGDLVFPVPYASGSFNNLTPYKLVTSLMEQMGVYWTFGYGNHDTEAYSYYTRKQISDFVVGKIKDESFKYCIYTPGPDDVDGYGNQVINVKNSAGKITQSLFVLDSHSYESGFLFNYDNLHQNQVDWYEKEVNRLTDINGGEVIKSLMFFHIPLVEYKTAFDEYKDNGHKDTDNVKYIYGIAGEPDELVCCGVNEDNMFEKMLELRSTQGVFVGHDHLNNFSLEYNGGEGDYSVRLTYGLSIDYLAYFGIVKKTAQRGGTVITIRPDTTFDCYGLRMVDHHEIHKVGDYEA